MALFMLALLPLALSTAASSRRITSRVTMSTAASRQLRLAGVDDLERVAQLQLDTFDPAPEEPEKPPSMFGSLFGTGGASSRAARKERLTVELNDRLSKGSDIWVVEAEPGLFVGTADLSEQEMLLPTHSLADGLYLSSMAVDSGSRRLGVAREMLRAALARSVDRGASGIFLHVERSNAPAISLYETEGFVKLPPSPRYDAFTTALKLSQKEPLLMFKQLEMI